MFKIWRVDCIRKTIASTKYNASIRRHIFIMSELKFCDIFFRYRYNFLRVLVYFEDLNYEIIDQEPLYEVCYP